LRNTNSSQVAFSLIELLVVVAIIAILAAIAVPNFLEAQTRAKVSRAQSDLRTITVGLEAYRIDANNYPPCYVYPSRRELSPLTTPVAYLSSVPAEVFNPHDALGNLFAEPIYDFVRYRYERGAIPVLHVDDTRSVGRQWFLVSVGPDNQQEHLYINIPVIGFVFITNTYDPTNGTVSRGDIFRVNEPLNP
jgi:prepilin-type N-terminal cleavage/methylation domain-containing protein